MGGVPTIISPATRGSRASQNAKAIYGQMIDDFANRIGEGRNGIGGVRIAGVARLSVPGQIDGDQAIALGQNALKLAEEHLAPVRIAMQQQQGKPLPLRVAHSYVRLLARDLAINHLRFRAENLFSHPSRRASPAR
jgi:hypothetical protein